VLGSEDWYFLFLLPDGWFVGAEKILDSKGKQKPVNHAEIMGVTPEDGDFTALKTEFCSANKIIRVDVADLHLYVEIFKTLPNEAQWGAIGTLYKQTKRNMTWDVWLKNKWKHNKSGTLSELKRVIDAKEKEGLNAK